MTNYEKYQLQWMLDHDYSLSDLVQGLMELQYDDPEDSDRISQPITELFKEWVADVGFAGTIWPCEAEWREGDAKSTDFFGVVRWCDEDIEDALTKSGYKVTDEAISIIRRQCEHHFFKDNMIETGWDTIYCYISECKAQLERSEEDPEDEF